MNAYEHKTTREIRTQEFSPGDDWELIARPNWVDCAIGSAALILFVLFFIWLEGK